MNRITIAKGHIAFNFTDNNLIKKTLMWIKTTRAQLISGRLAIARLAVDNNGKYEYAIIPCQRGG